MNHITKMLVLSIAGPAIAVGNGAGMANADPSSTLNAHGHGIVRTQSANFFKPSQNILPSNQSGCRYWAMSTLDSNANAMQRYNAGFAALVTFCGGDGA